MATMAMDKMGMVTPFGLGWTSGITTVWLVLFFLIYFVFLAAVFMMTQGTRGGVDKADGGPTNALPMSVENHHP